MKVLLIGGTGTISSAVSKRLAAQGFELYLLNMGTRNIELPENARCIQDDINNESDTAKKLGNSFFDAVCDFIAFTPEQTERDFRLFSGKTKQYIFISSASAYHKPVLDYRITEGTALANPYWKYSRDKIACEDFLMKCIVKMIFL